MERDSSFLDRLAAQLAANDRHHDQVARAKGRERSDQYREGQSIAADIIGRVAAFGSTYECNTATLRDAARKQPDTLAGRVAAGQLAEAASSNEAATPDTQAEARRIDALTAAERIAAARARRNDRYRCPDREV